MTHLALLIIAYQQKHDVESRVLARDIGIGESTLCRIKKGTMPDAAGLAKIISWMIRPDASAHAMRR